MLVDLLNGWAADRGDGRGFSTKAHPARIGVVYALTAHAYKMGFAVNTLLNAGFKLETVPSIRAAYESTLTLSWIAQIDDGLPAYLNRSHSQQKALRDTAKKAGWASADTPIPADELDAYLVSKDSKERANNTEKLCSDFYNGHAMYSMYRALSGLAHPSAHIVDLYLAINPNTELPILHTTAQYGDDRDYMITWLHILCSTLVWAARALNLINAERARSADRKRLRDAAAALKIAEFLRVTEEAKFRGERAERRRSQPIRPDASN
jgi:hypothetical protein